MSNRSEIKDFTKGDLTSHIIRFAIPILLSHLMMVLLNTVDMIVVGQKLGEAGTSAVTIGGSVAMLLNAFINGFSSAAQVIISIKLGAGERNKISRFVSTACGFIFISAILSMCIMLPLADTALRLLNTPPEAYDGALEYSRICLLGIIPIYAYHIISSIVRGFGDSKHPLIFIAIACGLNIVLDIVFVLNLDMGVGGAALATVIAQLVSVIFSVIMIIRKKESFGLSVKLKDFVFWDKTDLSAFIKLAVPMAINNSAIQISNMLINSMINDYGVTVSAFSGVRATIATTVDLILGAFAVAGAMIIGQNIAAGKSSRVKGTILRIGAITLSISTALACSFMLFPIKLFGIFTSERDVLNIVYSFLPILIFSFVTAGIRHTLSSLISGSGNKKINLAVALLDAVVARISFAVIFGVLLDLGYMGLLLGTALAELVPIFIGLAFYFFGSWKKGKGKSEIQI